MKNILKRTLSVLLALTMVVSTFMIFDPLDFLLMRASAAWGLYASDYSEFFYYPSGTTFIQYFATGYSNKSGSTGSNTAKAEVTTPGYTLIDFDLNSGGGGAFIYTGYKTTSDHTQAIRGFSAIDSKPGASANYQEVIGGITWTLVGYQPVSENNGDADEGTNMNEGRGGDGANLWLFATKDAAAGAPVISVCFDNSASVPSGYTDTVTYARSWSNTGYSGSAGAAFNTNANSGTAHYMHLKRAATINLDSLRTLARQARVLYDASTGTGDSGLSTLSTRLTTAENILNDFIADGYSNSYQQSNVNTAATNLQSAINAVKSYTRTYVHHVKADTGVEFATDSAIITQDDSQVTVTPKTGSSLPNGYYYDGTVVGESLFDFDAWAQSSSCQPRRQYTSTLKVDEYDFKSHTLRMTTKASDVCTNHGGSDGDGQTAFYHCPVAVTKGETLILTFDYAGTGNGDVGIICYGSDGAYLGRYWYHQNNGNLTSDDMNATGSNSTWRHGTIEFTPTSQQANTAYISLSFGGYPNSDASSSNPKTLCFRNVAVYRKGAMFDMDRWYDSSSSTGTTNKDININSYDSSTKTLSLTCNDGEGYTSYPNTNIRTLGYYYTAVSPDTAYQIEFDFAGTMRACVGVNCYDSDFNHIGNIWLFKSFAPTGSTSTFRHYSEVIYPRADNYFRNLSNRNNVKYISLCFGGYDTDNSGGRELRYRNVQITQDSIFDMSQWNYYSKNYNNRNNYTNLFSASAWYNSSSKNIESGSTVSYSSGTGSNGTITIHTNTNDRGTKYPSSKENGYYYIEIDPTKTYLFRYDYAGSTVHSMFGMSFYNSSGTKLGHVWFYNGNSDGGSNAIAPANGLESFSTRYITIKPNSFNSSESTYIQSSSGKNAKYVCFMFGMYDSGSHNDNTGIYKNIAFVEGAGAGTTGSYYNESYDTTTKTLTQTHIKGASAAVDNCTPYCTSGSITSTTSDRNSWSYFPLKPYATYTLECDFAGTISGELGLNLYDSDGTYFKSIWRHKGAWAGGVLQATGSITTFRHETITFDFPNETQYLDNTNRTKMRYGSLVFGALDDTGGQTAFRNVKLRCSNLKYTASGGVREWTLLYRPYNYTLHFDGNGAASGSTADVTASGAGSFTMPSCGFTAQAGYQFDRWLWQAKTYAQYTSSMTSYTAGGTLVGHKLYTDSNISGYASYDASTHTYSATLYALWKPINYTITFNSNGGDTYMNGSRGYNITSSGTLGTPTRTGYDFTGWKASNVNGNWTNGQTYPASKELAGMRGNVTLTAQWSIASFELTYDNEFLFTDYKAKEKVNDTNHETMTFNEAEGSLIATSDGNTRFLSRPYKGTNAPFMQLKVGHTYRVTATAQNVGSVTCSPRFDACYSTGTADSDYKGFESLYFDTVSLAPGATTTMDRTITITSDLGGYTVLQIVINNANNGAGSNAGSVKYSNIVVQDITNPLEAAKSTPNLAADDVTAASTPRVWKTYATQYTSHPTISRSGYSFDGWYDSRDQYGNGTGNKVQLNSSNYTMPASVKQLWSKWSVNSYHVTFDVNHDSIRKNLFQPPIDSIVDNGLTYNYDALTGLITINGTFTANRTVFRVPIKNVAGGMGLAAGKYRVSMEYVPQDGSSHSGNGALILEVVDSSNNVLSSRIKAAVSDGQNSDSMVFDLSGTSVYNTADKLSLWIWKNSQTEVYVNAKYRIKVEAITSTEAATEFSPHMRTVTYNTAYGTMPSPVRTGYTFAGWKLNGTAVNAATVMTTASDHTLTADWTARTYRVYYRNGNTTNISYSDFTFDGANTLKTATALSLSKTYDGASLTFAGWYLGTSTSGANATTVNFTDGQSIGNAASATGEGDVYLYAVWKRGTTFYYLNSSGTRQSKTDVWQIVSGDTTAFSTSIPAVPATPTGFSSDNWTTSATTAATGTVSGTYTGSDKTFYAIYTRAVNFYAGTSTTIMANTPLQYCNTGAASTGKKWSLTPPTPTSINATWTAIGWTATPAASTPTYAGATTTITSDTGDTLYAVYSRDLILYYNENDNDGGSTNVTNHIGTLGDDDNGTSATQYFCSNGTAAGLISSNAVPLTSDRFERAGYRQTGWRTLSGTSDLTGTTYAIPNANTASSSTYEATVYAHWTPIKYDTAIDYNRGDNAAAVENERTFDVEFSIGNPTRTGYTFAGWKITQNGDLGNSGTARYGEYGDVIHKIASSSTLLQLNNNADMYFLNLASSQGTTKTKVTIQAQWTEHTFKVTYYNYDGTELTSTPSSRTTLTYGAAGTLKGKGTGTNQLDFSAPDGTYSFVGWATADGRTAVDYATTGAAVSLTSTQVNTLYEDYGDPDASHLVKLYAVYTRTATFYYVGSDGTHGTYTRTQIRNHNTSLTKVPPIPAAPDTWNGDSWSTTTTAASGDVTPGTTLNTAEGNYSGTSTAFYAVYTRNCTFYSGVSTSAMSGTYTQYRNAGPDTSGTSTTNETWKLATPVATSLTDYGWTHIGWKTSASASVPGSGYDVASTSSSTQYITAKTGADRTFYAVYSRGLTLTYNRNTSVGSTTIYRRSDNTANNIANSTNTQYFCSDGTAAGKISAKTVTITSYTNNNGDTVYYRDGYDMDGWCKTSGAASANVNGTSYKITADAQNTVTETTVTAEIFAHWAPIQYTVGYELDGGSEKANGHYPTTNIVFDTNEYVSAPTKDGWTFNGWTVTGYANTAKWGTESTDVNNGTFSSAIKNGATGDVYFKNLAKAWDDAENETQKTVTLTANWTRNAYQVSIRKNYNIGTVTAKYCKTAGTGANNVTITANTDTSGATNTTDKVPFGNTVTLEASNVAGYTFTGWTVTKSGTTTTVSTTAGSGNTHTFTMPSSNVMVVATYTKINYNITLSKTYDVGNVTAEYNNAAGNSVTVTGTTGGASPAEADKVPYQNTVTINATNVTGYTFKNWTVTKDGTATTVTTTAGAGNSATFAMPDSDVNIVANYDKNDYQVTIKKTYDVGTVTAKYTAADGTTNVTITATTGAGATNTTNKAPFESTVTLEASDVTGYTFTGWTVKDASDNDVETTAGSDNTHTFTMPASNVTVTANYTKKTYTVTVKKTYDVGTVTAKYTAADGTTNVTITATTEGATNNSKKAPFGNTVTLEVTDVNGYTFDGWTVKDASDNDVSTTAGTGNTVTFTVPASNVTVTANYVKNDYQVTIKKTYDVGTVTAKYTAADGTTNVTITATTGAGATNTTNKAPYGNTVTINASTVDGYTFTGWTVKDASDNDVTLSAVSGSTIKKTFSMPASNVTVTANYTKNTYSVTISKNKDLGTVTAKYKNASNGNVTVTATTAGATCSDANKAPFGNTVTLEASDVTGYQFDGWSVTKSGNTTVSTTAGSGNTATFGMPSDNVTITATYTALTYDITYSMNDGNSGTATLAGSGYTAQGSDVYTIESAVTLPYASRSGYAFLGWQPTGTNNWGTTTIGNRTQVTAYAAGKYGDVTFTAQWERSAYSISYDLNDDGTFPAVLAGTNYTEAGNEAYTVTDSVTLPYATRDGYTFNKWTPDGAGNWGTTPIGNASNIYPVGTGKYGDVTFTANWTANTYTITLDLNDKNGSTAADLEDSTGYTLAQSKSGNTQSTIYTITYQTGDDIELPFLLRDGYNFSCSWFVVPNSNNMYDGNWIGETEYFADDIVSDMYGNVTFRAESTSSSDSWTMPKQYIITYQPGAANVKKSNDTTASDVDIEGYYFDNDVTLPTMNTNDQFRWTRTGYTFGGWLKSGVSGVTPFADGATVNGGTGIQAGDADPVTLVAQWDTIKYTITYNLADNTTASKGTLKYLSTETAVPSTDYAKDTTGGLTTYSKQYTIEDALVPMIVERAGYNFIDYCSWIVTSADADSNWTDWYGGQNGASFGGNRTGMIGNVTLTAEYQLTWSKVVVDPDGGDMTVTYLDVVSDDNPALPSNLQDDLMTEVIEQLDPENPQTAEIYPLFGTEVTLSVPVKEGYTFREWIMTSVEDLPCAVITNNGTTAPSVYVVGAGDENDDDYTMTLTAQYDKTQYRIVYDRNGYTDTNLHYIGDSVTNAIYSEVTVTPANGTTSVTLPKFYNNGQYVYAEDTNEVRYPIGWNYTGTDSNSRKTADANSGATVSIETLKAYATDTDTANIKQIRIYTVWSANYYDLEVAAGSFQNAYMTFDANAPMEHNRYYTGTPSYARLPITDTTGADSRYIFTAGTTNEASNIYTRAVTNHYNDARDDYGKYDEAGRYVWVAPAIGTAQTRQAADDFSQTTVNDLNTAYCTYTTPLKNAAAHNGQNLVTQANQDTLTQYAAKLSTSATTPKGTNSILKGMKLADIDRDEAFSIASILATAQSVDGNITNKCGTGSAPLTDGNTLESKYVTLLHDTFGETVYNHYPYLANEVHSYNSLLELCNAVIDPYRPSANATPVFTEQVSGSKYTKESVQALYNTLTAMQTEIENLKMPSEYRYKYIVAKLAMAYHSLVLDMADFSEFDNLWFNYVMATWGKAGDNKQTFSLDPSRISGLNAYFTTASVTAVSNKKDELDAYALIWKSVLQNAVDGKSGTRTCKDTYSDGGYYTLTTSEAAAFSYAEGTLCDQLLDAIDALVPLPADYTAVFNWINRIPYSGSTSPYPGEILPGDAGAATLLTQWKTTWGASGVFDLTQENNANYAPYDIYWLTRYYTHTSLVALKNVLDGIVWNLTAINQPIINGTLTGGQQSYADQLRDAIVGNGSTIAGLTPKQFRVITNSNYQNNETNIVTTYAGYTVGEGSEAVMIPYHYGDTFNEGAPQTYGGWTLQGYNTQPGGTGRDFSLLAPNSILHFDIDDNVTEYFVGNAEGTVYTMTLYAKWQRNNSYLRIYSDGGTMSVHVGTSDWEITGTKEFDEFSAAFGSALTVTTPQKTGYTFSTWTFEPDAENNGSSSFAPVNGVDTYTFGMTKDAVDVLRANFTARTFTLYFDPNGGAFTNAGGFTAGGTTTQSKQVTYDNALNALSSGKTWPTVVKEIKFGNNITMHAQFLGWKAGNTTYNGSEQYKQNGDLTLVAQYAVTEAFEEKVNEAFEVNANNYTLASLQAVDAQLTEVVENGGEITADLVNSLSATLEEKTTDNGAPRIKVYENDTAITNALNQNGYTDTEKTEIRTLMANRDEISYVKANSMYYTYFCYTNSTTPFILVDAEDLAYGGEVASYPTTVSMESGNNKYRSQPYTSSGRVTNRAQWYNKAAWYTVDGAGSARNANYAVRTRTVAENPYESLTYVGAAFNNGKNYSYYNKAQYILLTPTFIENDGLQYALYTFTVSDDSTMPEAATTADLMGATDYETATQNLNAPASASVTPKKTISIFIEYNNTMKKENGEYVTDAGGQRVDASGHGVSAGSYLNVYNNADPTKQANWKQDEAWRKVDYVYRTAGSNTRTDEFVLSQTKDGSGNYSNYLAASPQYGQNEYGSFYKLMSQETDGAAVTAYWTAYDQSLNAGNTPLEARRAGANAALAKLNGPNGTITKDIQSGTIEMVDGTQAQAVGADNCGAGKNGCLGQYIAWPSTGTTWSSQFYATATCREDALVYVHLYDYFGNEYTNVLQRDYQEHQAPTAQATGVGQVTVTERGGSGIKTMKVTQYSQDGSGKMLTALGGSVNNVYDSGTNTFTISGLGKGTGTNNIFSLYIEDRAGYNTTIDFSADTADNGSVVITVNDVDRMNAVVDEPQASQTAAAPMTLMQIDEGDDVPIIEPTMQDVTAGMPYIGEDTYTFTLNDTYTVNLFAPEGRDYELRLRTNDGGMIKAYIDGEYAPVQAGKIIVPGGSNVQIRAAAKGGYELASLVMTYEDGESVELTGAYNAELRDNATISATFALSDALYTVTVQNGAVNGRPSMRVSPNNRVTVAAAAAPNGKTFAYWAVGGADGTPVSYDATYTFVVTGDTALTAVYSDTAVQQTASIVMDAANAAHVKLVNGKYTLSYSGKITLPEGATIDEFGMVLTAKTADECTAEDFVIGAAGTAKLTGETLSEQGQFRMNVNNVAPGATRTGRLFLTVTLADGTTQTIYSDTWSELTAA